MSNNRKYSGHGGRNNGSKRYDKEGWRSISNNSIIKQWGGMFRFMRSHGLNPHDHRDFPEAHDLIDEIKKNEWTERHNTSNSNSDISDGRQDYDPEGWRSISNNSIVKQWGGMFKFMRSHGLNPHDHRDFPEAHDLIDEIKKNEWAEMHNMSDSDRSDPEYDPEGWRSISNNSIVKDWGGMNRFMLSYGLKPYNDDDYEEARLIIDEMKKAEWADRHGISY